MDGHTASLEKMRADGVAEAAVDTFGRYYEQLAAGDVGTLPESDLKPVDELPDAEELPEDEEGATRALEQGGLARGAVAWGRESERKPVDGLAGGGRAPRAEGGALLPLEQRLGGIE